MLKTRKHVAMYPTRTGTDTGTGTTSDATGLMEAHAWTRFVGCAGEQVGCWAFLHRARDTDRVAALYGTDSAVRSTACFLTVVRVTLATLTTCAVQWLC